MSTPAERVMNKIRAQMKAALEAEPEEEEDDDGYCVTCAGTGEGMHDGTSCQACKGRGVTKPKDRAPYYIQRMFDAADHQRDMERDDKLTGDRS